MKKLLFPVLLCLLLVAGCGAKQDPLVKAMNGRWEVDYDETAKATLALQGVSDLSPEQVAGVQNAMHQALGAGAFFAFDTRKMTFSCKIASEKIDAVPFKVVQITGRTVQISYEGMDDLITVREDGLLQITGGGGSLVLRKSDS